MGKGVALDVCAIWGQNTDCREEDFDADLDVHLQMLVNML